MLKFVVFFALVLVCNADLPAPTPAPVLCGQIPSAIYGCLGNPKVVESDAAAQCTKHFSECEKMKCIFRKSGWLKEDKIDKAKVSDHFDQFAKNNPNWTATVDLVKVNCLTYDLPAQGVYINCPAYDVVFCSLTNFVKNAPASQWSSSPNCNYPRQFAQFCPMCPTDCFSPQVPYRSCNACILLPRSP